MIEKKPLYVQLTNQLIDYISTDCVIGDRFMPEQVIADTYAVSRSTVKHSLEELEDLGFISKTKKVGYFVNNKSFKKNNLATFYSFTEQMRIMGKEPSSEILKFSLTHTNHYISSILKISDDEKVYQISRIRLADNQPILLEKTYLRASMFPDLKRRYLLKDPLYDVFRKRFNIVPTHAEEEFFASYVNQKESDLLEMSFRDPCLMIQRTTVDQYNRPIEFTVTTAPADMFSYRVALNEKKNCS